MSGPEYDATQPSFPAYAELTQTQAWRQTAPRIQADTDIAADSVDTSRGSRYTEGAVLGTGGMGKVMLARPTRARSKIQAMPTCRECNDEVDKVVTVKVGGKARKLCSDCADRLREAGEIAEASEGVIQGMMGYKGRR